jgi:hypothetical protein
VRRQVVTCDDCETDIRPDNHDWLSVEVRPHPYGPLPIPRKAELCGPCARTRGLDKIGSMG